MSLYSVWELPQSKYRMVSSLSKCPIPPASGNTDLFSRPIVCLFWNVRTWNDAELKTFKSGFFSAHNAVHPHCCRCPQFLPFYSCVVFHGTGYHTVDSDQLRGLCFLFLAVVKMSCLEYVQCCLECPWSMWSSLVLECPFWSSSFVGDLVCLWASVSPSLYRDCDICARLPGLTFENQMKYFLIKKLECALYINISEEIWSVKWRNWFRASGITS